MQTTKIVRRKNNFSSNNRVLEYLATNPELEIVRAIIKKSPPSVIKVICNAAINALKSDRIVLPKQLKSKFKKNRKIFEKLCQPKLKIERKRKLIQNGRGFLAILPSLLATVLPAIGSALFASRENSPTPDF